MCRAELARLDGIEQDLAIPRAPRSHPVTYIIYVSPHVTCPSHRYTPADLLFAHLRKWKDRPRHLHHLGFTRRLHRALHCHPVLLLLHYSTPYNEQRMTPRGGW